MDRRQAGKTLARLNRDALRIAGRFDLQYRSIEAERANVSSRYGICYSDGTIRIRLRHATTGRSLKYSSLVNTLCHELTHLRHFNHGRRFKALYLRMLEWSRREGIYRPGSPGTRADPDNRQPFLSTPAAAAQQLSLFGPWQPLGDRENGSNESAA